MILAQELRIGNWVMIDPSSTPQQVCDVMCDCITTENIRGAHYGLVDAIPLTEEWLSKFGFKIWDRNKWSDLGMNIVLLENGDNFLFLANQRHVNIFYVHQLQNLYFVLTGEELTIKEVKK
jgi:hypothetical protein